MRYVAGTAFTASNTLVSFVDSVNVDKIVIGSNSKQASIRREFHLVQYFFPIFDVIQFSQISEIKLIGYKEALTHLYRY